MAKKILITGNEGKIGKHLEKAYKEIGCDVRGFDVVGSKDRSILNTASLKENMTDIDVVVHLAAIPHPDPGKDFREYFDINVCGTLNVFECAIARHVKRIIYASSIGYYGVNIDGKLLPEYFPIDEKSKIASIDQASQGRLDAYNQSKVMAEQICAYFGTNRKIESIVLRLAPANDLDEQYPPDQEIPYGNYQEKCFWANVDLKNVRQAFLKALAYEGPCGYEVFNIANRSICKRVPVEEWREKTYPDVPHTCQGHDSMYGIDKAASVLGYKPEG